MNRNGAIILVMVIIVALLGYWGWQIKRELNYSWSYETKVERTVQDVVCDMVKREYLKNPSDC